MKFLVLGSLNIDRTYRVRDFVLPKQTISAHGYECFCGGKGFNQAIALARAGGDVSFAGVLGDDGDMLIEGLAADGVDTSLLRRTCTATGHAVIQVSPEGENCIIVAAGANGEVTREYIDSVLPRFSAGDMIVLQNEVTNVDYAISAAKKQGLRVAFNPSPYDEAIARCDMALVDLLLLNEVEGAALTGEEDPKKILAAIHRAYPRTAAVLTLGGAGAMFLSAAGETAYSPAAPCKVVDTTAAGDTFTGYFLTSYAAGAPAEKALRHAAAASALAVSRKGASPSIPHRAEVEMRL